MHFITFPVASTNIFPLSNSTKGGQLVTEYNLKSREMVATNPAIKYAVGPSFIHSSDDFKVKLLEDTDVPDYDATKTYDKGDYCRYNNTTYICVVQITDPEPFDSEHWSETSISNSIIQVDPGRAVINGHFVESLAPMIVDMQLANIELKQNSQEQLYGNLSIGIKSYFSTSNTMSGAMLIENTDNMYVGVQLVVTKTADFKTPDDCPTNQDEVTADIKLADFTYINGTISKSSIVPNADATRYIPSARIHDFDSILDDKYVTSENLIDKFFYTYSGKSGWCDSTGSIMVWDSHPKSTTTEPKTQEAVFATDANGDVKLVIPHKQQDGIIDDNGDREYYADKVLDFPTANYALGTSGIVNEEYTKHIKDVASVINTYKQFTNGKQILYLDTLSYNSEGGYSYEFPVDLSNFNVGDYILVREDYTVSPSSEDDSSAPSTMYFVLPGGVSGVRYSATRPAGVRLGNVATIWEGDDPSYQQSALEHIADFYVVGQSYHVGDYAAYGEKTYRCISNTSGEWDATCWEVIFDDNALTLFAYTSYKGVVGVDYFEATFRNTLDSTVTSYYYPVATSDPKTWSEAVKLNGGIPLATNVQIGGFYNASNDPQYADAGYVYLDDTGHLRLMDYALLRSGTLAYQLGADFRIPSNQTLEYIQAYLDESVNARVAFRTNATPTSTPDMINVYIPLPEEDGVLNIYDLDSRFGTGVYIHFLMDDKTKDYSNIVINIADCEKIRIDSSITTVTSGPMINIFRSCLYYDAEVINYVRLCDPSNKRADIFPDPSFTGFDNLTLWYERFSDSDPDIVVNGMEVSQPNVAMVTQDIAFWSEDIPDDNHYSYALRSITLSGSGKLIACSLYVSNSTSTTAPIVTTRHIILGGDFILPQGSALNYPMACVNSPIKVTGVFTTAYKATQGAEWIVTETSFTALSGIYTPANGMTVGSIAFNSETSLIESTYIPEDRIGAWEPGSYHIFYGGTTV